MRPRETPGLQSDDVDVRTALRPEYRDVGAWHLRSRLFSRANIHALVISSSGCGRLELGGWLRSEWNPPNLTFYETSPSKTSEHIWGLLYAPRSKHFLVFWLLLAPGSQRLKSLRQAAVPIWFAVILFAYLRICRSGRL
jgi:hypothetical protein